MTSGNNKTVPFPVRRRDNRRILIFVAALTVLFFVVICFVAGGGRVFRAIRRQLLYGEEAHTISRAATHTAALWGSTLAAAGEEGITVYDRQGNTAFVVSASMEAPVLQAGEDTLLAWDAGGTALVLLDKKGNALLPAQSYGTLYDADLSPDGCLAVLSAGSREKAILQVFDREQRSSFTLHADTRFLSRCAIAPQGKHLAALSLEQGKEGFQSVVLVYDTGKEAPVAEVSLGDQIIYDMAFLNSKTLCLVGEKAVTTMNVAGELLGSYPYETLYSYSLSGDGFALLSVLTDGKESLVTLDKKARPIAAWEQGPCQVSAAGPYALWLGEGELVLSDKQLRNRFLQEATSLELACVGGLGQVYGFQNREARLYLP